MKLSIIMPVYNVKKYLSDVIRDILSQTFQDFELILVDDGSTDGSATICDEWKEKDERIVVVQQKNQGSGMARNSGLKTARGEFVGFVDSDDRIHPQMFEVLIKTAMETVADVVMCGFEKVGESTAIKKEKYDISNIEKTVLGKEIIYRRMFSDSTTEVPFLVVWNKIIRKEIAVTEMFPKTGSEDSVYNLKVYNKAQKVVMIDTKLCFYYYVQHQGSLTNTRFSKYKLETIESYFFMENFVKENASEFHKYILEKMYKKILSSRYSANGTMFENEVKQVLKKKFPEFNKRFWESKDISFVKKVMYTIFYSIPLSYTFFRYIMDRQARK